MKESAVVTAKFIAILKEPIDRNALFPVFREGYVSLGNPIIENRYVLGISRDDVAPRDLKYFFVNSIYQSTHVNQGPSCFGVKYSNIEIQRWEMPSIVKVQLYPGFFIRSFGFDKPAHLRIRPSNTDIRSLGSPEVVTGFLQGLIKCSVLKRQRLRWL